MDYFPKMQCEHYYHIYNRTNGNENLFIEEMNYYYFLRRLSLYTFPVADIVAYCLLKNHFHLLIKIKPEAEITKNSNDWCQQLMIPPVKLKPELQLSKAFNSYAKGVNKKYERHGSIFQKRFRRIGLTDHSHLLNTIAYIHVNAEHHGLVDRFYQWKFTSYHLAVGREHSSIHDLVLPLFGGRTKCIEFHHAFVRARQFDKVFQEQ